MFFTCGRMRTSVRPPYGLHVHPRPAPHLGKSNPQSAFSSRASAQSLSWAAKRVSDCRDDLIALAEATRIRVLQRPRYGRLSVSHPLNGQIIGNPALLGDQRPDAALLLGTRFGFTHGRPWYISTPTDARLIQCTATPPNSVAFSYRLPIVADVGAALHMLRAAAAPSHGRSDLPGSNRRRRRLRSSILFALRRRARPASIRSGG